MANIIEVTNVRDLWENTDPQSLISQPDFSKHGPAYQTTSLLLNRFGLVPKSEIVSLTGGPKPADNALQVTRDKLAQVKVSVYSTSNFKPEHLLALPDSSLARYPQALLGFDMYWEPKPAKTDFGTLFNLYIDTASHKKILQPGITPALIEVLNILTSHPDGLTGDHLAKQLHKSPSQTRTLVSELREQLHLLTGFTIPEAYHIPYRLHSL